MPLFTLQVGPIPDPCLDILSTASMNMTFRYLAVFSRNSANLGLGFSPWVLIPYRLPRNGLKTEVSRDLPVGARNLKHHRKITMLLTADLSANCDQGTMSLSTLPNDGQGSKSLP